MLSRFLIKFYGVAVRLLFCNRISVLASQRIFISLLFRKRLIEAELLDNAEPEEARLNLADLVRINKNFGGYSSAASLLSRVATPGQSFTLLDVGAASGDTGRYLSKLYPQATITSLDYNSVNARAASPPKLIADAFQLPFAPASFDFVFSSLFLHHFANEEVIQLLTSFYALARKALLVVDLERNFLPFCFLPMSRWLFKWNRITVHDGMISVRAAFTQPELVQLASAAGMHRFSVEAHRPAFRLSLLAPK